MSSLSIYAARESGLHHLNPLTKFMLTISIFVCGFVLPGQWTSFWILGLVIMPLSLWAKVAGRLVNLVLKISWPLIISLLIIQTFFWGEGTALFHIGFLQPKLEGLIFAIKSSGRIMFIMADFLLFSLTTRPDTLMISLKQKGMPAGLAYIIVTTLQLVPQFITKANTILDAQRSRGLETEGNFATRARALLPLILPLVIGSLLEVEERAIAIEARAFNSRHKETSLLEISDSRAQGILRFGLIVLTLLFIAGRILWPL